MKIKQIVGDDFDLLDARRMLKFLQLLREGSLNERARRISRISDCRSGETIVQSGQHHPGNDAGGGRSTMNPLTGGETEEASYTGADTNTLTWIELDTRIKIAEVEKLQRQLTSGPKEEPTSDSVSPL